MSKRLCAWAIKHDRQGLLVLNTLYFLPEGEAPDTKANWCRLSWLDEPRNFDGQTEESAAFEDRPVANTFDDLARVRANLQSSHRRGASASYELGRADERINVNDVLVAVEMVLRDFVHLNLPGTSPEEIERVLKLVREYRAQTEEIKQLGREKGWYPR